MLKSYYQRPTIIFNLTSTADPDSVRYGDVPNSVFDNGTPVKAWVAPSKESEEFIEDRDSWLQEFDVRYPIGTLVAPESQIEFEGRRHKVVGLPRTFYKKRKADHIHVRMSVVKA